MFIRILPLFAVFAILPLTVMAADNDLMACQEKHPEWYRCSTNEDCEIGINACGWPILGVNKNFTMMSEICNRSAGAFLDCAMWQESETDKIVAACTDGVCNTYRKGSSDLSPAP